MIRLLRRVAYTKVRTYTGVWGADKRVRVWKLFGVTVFRRTIWRK